MTTDGPEDTGDLGGVSMWTSYSARKWAVRWLQGQREVIGDAARDEQHARHWIEKEAAKATMQARRLMESPTLAERQIVLAEVIRREILPNFDSWFAGSWEPEEPTA